MNTNIFLFFLIFPIVGWGQENTLDIKYTQEDKVISLLENKIKVSKRQYLQKGKECKKEASTNKIKFDKNIFKELDNKTFLIATMYHVRKGIRMCSYQEKIQLVYDLNILINFKNDKKLNAQNELDLLYITLSKPDYYFYDEIKYQSLPEKTKKYFEDIFEDIPYGIEAVRELSSQWRGLKKNP